MASVYLVETYSESDGLNYNEAFSSEKKAIEWFNYICDNYMQRDGVDKMDVQVKGWRLYCLQRNSYTGVWEKSWIGIKQIRILR